MSVEVREEKEVSIFRNGRSRAVRIPSDFKIEGESVLMSQTNDGIIHIRPKEKRMTLVETLDWLAEQEPFGEEMPEIDDPPPEAVELGD